jgi:hypothetical protein
MKVIFGNRIQKEKFGLIIIKRLSKKKKFLHREPLTCLPTGRVDTEIHRDVDFLRGTLCLLRVTQ